MQSPDRSEDSEDEAVYVTRPALPPLEEILPYLEQIWQSHRLTNRGPFHDQLEGALGEYLGVDYISLFANGTLALVTAMQALRISGEVITTPYSFVATANALLWNNLTPVFVDIDPETLNLDPVQVEAAITTKTTAILPVHVYGHPCATDEIQHIADLYGLKVIYDAAHCFGVEDSGGSVLRHGDLSILSFHATKVYTTFEGGAVISPDVKTKQRIDYLKNFGFANETTVVAAGINSKMNEFQAAVGLAQLNHIDQAIRERAAVDRTYRERLESVPGITCHRLPQTRRHNYCFFPIFVERDYPLTRNELYFELFDAGIRGRRYFYPLICDFPMYRNQLAARKFELPVARETAECVICLPIYPGLSGQAISRACDIIATPPETAE